MNTKISKTLYTAARIVLGLVFVFSGFVKAIDPRGFGYKIDEYLNFFEISFPQWLNLPLITGIIIIMVEFVLGIYLVIGIRRKFSSYLTLFLTVTFTTISIFILIFKPVEDCGCFGDFFLLSDTQTVLKNIVLLALAIFLLPHAGRLPAFVPRNWQWFVSLYTGIFIFVFILRTIYFIPILDFRPYKIGANIRELVFPKNIEDGEVPLDLYITDQSGQDMTADILFETRPVMLVVSPRLIESDSGVTEELNAINDWCTDHEYKMYCVTSSPLAEIKEWSYYNDIQYPILLGDHTTLKTIVRSNPGLLLLRDGVVRNKWSCHNLPDVSNKNLKETQLEAQPDIFAKTLLKFMLWYLLPILFLILISNLVHHLQRKMSRKSTNSIINNFNIKTQTTMRQKIVAGNWKMNMTLQEGVALAKELSEALAADKPNCGVVICTPFIHLATIAPMLDTNVIKLGAENCADKEKGAYTGEVSAAMVKSTGAEYVILGHSERRAYYGETPEILKEKVNLALANGLKVIFCIGEVLEEREAGKQNEVVAAQLAGSLYDLTKEQFSNIVLAYEPVWAIGTGKTATADQAQEMHAFIRSEIAKQFGEEVAENTTIQYGGSCKPSNAKELFAKPDVDGGLIGGAALKAADFKGIIDAWKK